LVAIQSSFEVRNARNTGIEARNGWHLLAIDTLQYNLCGMASIPIFDACCICGWRWK
jgi:hypothetical protein